MSVFHRATPVLYVYICIHLFISLSTYLSIYLSIDLSIYLSIYRSIYLSIYLSIYISLHAYIHACMHTCIPTYMISMSFKTPRNAPLRRDLLWSIYQPLARELDVDISEAHLPRQGRGRGQSLWEGPLVRDPVLVKACCAVKELHFNYQLTIIQKPCYLLQPVFWDPGLCGSGRV